MVALASLFIVVLVSLLVTRIATVALDLTGMSHESARFQARSAFFGVGFTTNEAESVVNHPVRRRIVMALMFAGNAFALTGIASLVLSFTGGSAGDRALKIGVLVGGLALLVVVVRSPWVDRRLSRLIERVLRRFTGAAVRDYAALLNVEGEYDLAEMKVRPEDWVADRTLGELKLRDEGLIVLGIHRADGSYIGAPDGATRIGVHDNLVLYGREHRVAELDCRQAGPDGHDAHERAVTEQERIEREEEIRDPRPV